jgi:serine protease
MHIKRFPFLIVAALCLAMTTGARASNDAQRTPVVMAPAQTLSGQQAAPRASRPAQLFDTKSLLVRFKPGTSLGLKAQARGLIKGKPLRSYSLISGLEQVSIGGPGLSVEAAMRILKRLPFVDYALPNDVIFAEATYPNDEYFPEQWALDNTGQDSMFGAWVGGVPDADVDAPQAWDVTTTSDAVVAVIDTGVTLDHPDLQANVWTNPGEIANNNLDDDGNGYVDDVHGWDFANGDNDPLDGHGHGSHVSGIIAAVGNNGVGTTGVMWHGKVMALKALADNGTGYLADAVAALEYAVANGARVSNNSWGYYGNGGEPAGHQALRDAIAAAQAGNHLFVAAAGNDAFDNDALADPHYPSSFDLDNIISVAATDNTDALSYFSNYGATTVDIGAPGSDVFSTWKYNCVFGTDCGYDYAWLSGTSMATPHVSAVAALVFGRHPDWSYGQVRDRVFNTARPVAALDGITATGGVVNVSAALQEGGTPPAAPSALAATVVSHSQIDLAWTDNSGDEQGFQVERSSDQESWAFVASVGAAVTTYSDTGLAADTTYYYRVRAYNLSGSSGYTNTASATTDIAPPGGDVTASAEIAVSGTVGGDYTDTYADDDRFETVTEVTTGGKKSDRYSYLDHKWTFDVGTGATLTLFIDASASSDGEGFSFEYSADDGVYTPLCTVAGHSGCDAAGYPLSPMDGTIYVRVVDTDRTPGNTAKDSVYVDHLYIHAEGGTGGGGEPPPPADINLTASGYKVKGVKMVDLTWTGATGANVDIYRDGVKLLDSTANDGAETDDTGEKGGGSYSYNVCEQGSTTACSNTATVTF